MKLLVTGSAGFIGSELCLKLLEEGHHVAGIDNHNDYYETNLKEQRLKRQLNHPNYKHFRTDICDRDKLDRIFYEEKPERVVHLAAQVGVRYSTENPLVYIENNIVGFSNVLEECRHYEVEHLVYASSSSVYGLSTQVPHSVSQMADHPASIYAATKKSNELMAHSYSHLFNLPTTGLRFFTVYGPWGRPDMAVFKFTKKILENKKINIFNNGENSRDFTYVSDVVNAINNIIKKGLSWTQKNSDKAPFRVFNLGNNKSISILNFIKIIEKKLKKKAILLFSPKERADMTRTSADILKAKKEIDYSPDVTIKYGINKFVNWYLNYYTKK